MEIQLVKKSTGPMASSTGDAERLVIVGGGMAAHRLCQQLVTRGAAERFRVTVLSDEDGLAYDRVHLSDVLGGRAVEELVLSPEDWYRAHEVQWLPKARADSIDLARRTVTSSRGHVLPFDRLVLATGSSAIRPSIPGSDLPGVFTYRTREDVEAIAAAADEAARGRGRAVVVGGGLLGLEAASALADRGCEVTILERGPRLMPRQLDAGAARRLYDAVVGRGYALELGAELQRIEGDGARLRVALQQDWSIEADLVVFAIGVRPNDEVARRAGVVCHQAGGIVVDDTLETSVHRVHAIGECARHRDTLYGLVAPSYSMADALARQLLGDATPFEGVAPGTRLKLPGIEVSVVGDSLGGHRDDRALSWQDDVRYRSLTVRAGRLVGATSVGEWDGWARVQEAVAREARVRVGHERRFRDEGQLWRSPGARPIARWSDDAIVCTCTGVTCGALRAAVADGCGSSAALASATSASTVCGSCRPLLEELSGETTSASGRLDTGLLVAAFAGLSIALLVALGPPVPLTQSVRELAYDEIWRDPWLRKLTGFTTLGVCVASLVLSLRKRLPAVQRGAFGAWRRVHAFLGVAGVVGVGVHTGLRLGAGLDLALMTTFLGLTVLGAGAGAAAALERRLSPAAAGRLRRFGRNAHVLVFWPFLVLVGFHVFKVFWF